MSGTDHPALRVRQALPTRRLWEIRVGVGQRFEARFVLHA